MKEFWKDIEGFEGRYQISDSGEVKSLGRFVNGKNGSKRWIKETILKPCYDGNGYLQSSLRIDGKFMANKTHRIVAQTFIPNPDNLPQINHKNGNKEDCSVENLEWCTGEYNLKHAIETGLTDNVGIKNAAAKLTDSDVIKIKELKGKITHAKLAEMFNVTEPAIWKILNNRTWKHLI
jgi:hypothetical protein